MYCTRKVLDDLIWVGADDRRLPFFEGVYGVPDGVSYNSYLLLDEKTVLFDTVDKAVYGVFLENLAHELNGRPLDYLVVHHMEPDHAATLELVLQRYPEATVICNAKIKTMLAQFFPMDLSNRVRLVKEGDTFSSGRHSFTFVMAPMVHWPEVMMTYDTTDKILFTADAFGSFGALNGRLFADEVDFFSECVDEARRYYTNIVGKYGPQVQVCLAQPLRRLFGEVPAVVELCARGKERHAGLRLRLRPHRERRQHPRGEALREGCEGSHVRHLRHARKLYRLRRLPLQPSGLCRHDL